MPARVVFAVAADADRPGALLKCAQAVQRALHLLFVPYDPDELLHHLLQRVLHLKWALAGRTALERLERSPNGVVDLDGVHSACPVALGKLRRELASALAKPQQVRQRISAETLPPVAAPCTFACRHPPS